MEKRDEIMQNRKEIRDGRGNFHDEFGHLDDYLQTDLTVEEKGEIRDIINAHKQEIKDETDAFIEAFTSSDSADDEVAALVDDLVDLKSAMYDSLIPYVDVDQEDEFDVYVEELLAQFEVNYTKRLNNFIDHKEMDDDDSVNKGRKLPERFRGKIGKFMEKWDDSEKGDLLQTILTKVETKMAQIEGLDTLSEENQQLLLDYLSDLYDMVQDEYNSLVTDSDDVTEDELFDDIFGDDDDSDDDNSEDEVEGTVTSIEGMYVALTNGEIIKVLDSTDVENDGDLLSLAAVEDALAGDETVSVEAEGEYNADDVFVATTIKFETGSNDDDEEDDDNGGDDEDDDNGGDDDDDDNGGDDDEDEGDDD